MPNPPIHAPNYTQIPNVILDYWMPILSPAEFKVLICICRKTFGWKKEYDRISLKQIEKMTGLSRFGITKNIDSLIEKGLVTKVKSKTIDGDDAANQYEINVNSVDEGSQLSLPRVVNSLTQGVVNSVDPQKKDYTKERLTKVIPPSPLKGEAEAKPSSPSSAKNEQKKTDSSKAQVREHVMLSDDEHSKLATEYGEQKLNWMLDALDAYKGSTGKRYKSDYHTLLPHGWVHQRYLDAKHHTTSAVAKHRQGSKLAFETEKDTWRPPEHKPREKTPEEKARIAKEFGVRL